jgi:hypothetical protein
MSSKRKSSNTHYECDEDEFNIYEFNRIKSKKNRIDTINTMPEICNICGFGKLNEICRCIVNCNDINVDGYIIKMCNFCNDPVSICECNIVLWSTFNCNSCRIAHSVYTSCNETQCIICENYADYTENGCRCMNGNIKFINTDVNLRKLGNTQDFAEFLNKSELQPVCGFCEYHLAKCACLEKEEDSKMAEIDYKDEYEQMYMD